MSTSKCILPTLRPQILKPVNVTHLLQRLCLFICPCLLIIIFSRPPYPIQEYPSSTRIPEKVKDGEDEYDEGSRTKGREHADKDPLTSRTIVAADIYDNVGAFMRGCVLPFERGVCGWRVVRNEWRRESCRRLGVRHPRTLYRNIDGSCSICWVHPEVTLGWWWGAQPVGFGEFQNPRIKGRQ